MLSTGGSQRRHSTAATVMATVGTLLLTYVPFILLPLAVAWLSGELTQQVIVAYSLPAALSLTLGLVLNRLPGVGPVRARDAVLVVVAGWTAFALIGAVPLWLTLPGFSYLDAFFESMSGLTTTGVTVLTGLDSMARSLLFWRAELQFIGGLGILTFFLAVTFRSGEAPFHLFTAESHKISAPRLTPSVSRSIKLILGIYVGLVAVFAIVFWLVGMSGFDAATHAMTALSTGGFSTHDQSIAFFQASGYQHSWLIEWVVAVAMLAGGVNFFIHYKLLQGELSSLWNTSEIRLYWGLLAGVIVVILVGTVVGGIGLAEGLTEERVRTAAFQAASLLTSTGYGTRSISSDYFPLVARPLFLMLMFVGGSVGSTAGGVKVLRVTVLIQGIKRELKKLYTPRRAVQPLLIDGMIVPADEITRVVSLFFAWLVYVFGAGVITLLFSSHGLLGSFSAPLSMVGNMGPTFLPPGATAALHPAVKILYIIGMLAGRLEILPVLLFLTPRAWR